MTLGKQMFQPAHLNVRMKIKINTRRKFVSSWKTIDKEIQKLNCYKL